jgi:hypothetical protein
VDYVPTDEILDALAPQIGIEHFFNLGIELGLGAVYLVHNQDNVSSWSDIYSPRLLLQ